MTNYTATELRTAAGAVTASAAETELKHAAATADQQFDIFLSHSVADARAIAGLKRILEREYLSVYVDWMVDPHLERQSAGPRTADTLRTRMRQCKSLVYATSRSARNSRWMPWELGYFDGLRGADSVSICLIEEGNGSFVGQEYLGLYKKIEKLATSLGPRPFVLRSASEIQSMQSFAVGSNRL